MGAVIVSAEIRKRQHFRTAKRLQLAALESPMTGRMKDYCTNLRVEATEPASKSEANF